MHQEQKVKPSIDQTATDSQLNAFVLQISVDKGGPAGTLHPGASDRPCGRHLFLARQDYTPPPPPTPTPPQLHSHIHCFHISHWFQQWYGSGSAWIRIILVTWIRNPYPVEELTATLACLY
jgi:hypothetical protein